MSFLNKREKITFIISTFIHFLIEYHNLTCITEKLLGFQLLFSNRLPRIHYTNLILSIILNRFAVDIPSYIIKLLMIRVHYCTG